MIKNTQFVQNMGINVGVSYYSLESMKSVYNLTNSPFPIEFFLLFFDFIQCQLFGLNSLSPSTCISPILPP